MDADRWARLRDMVEGALAHEGDERERQLASACAGDEELLAQARELLAEDAAEDDRFDPPTRELLGADVRGRRVGAWELRSELGAGGMGTVYLAVRADEQFEKQVAVKLLKRGMDTSELLERFRRERQVLAALEHPGIARLIDGGATEDGLPFLVMEYVDGLPIDRWCDERRLTLRERLELFRKVCAAVQFAHQNLVVHRDLKPSNVLVTEGGEPKLLDFGIAKVLDPTRPAITRDLTHGLRFMTPEYASPEQVRGRPVATSSDVYSLGAVLYQLLTGHVAHRFTTRSPLEIERAVCENEPTRPSTAVAQAVERSSTRITPEDVSRRRETTPRGLRRELAGDLDTIVMKALRKEPQRRYSSVEQLSEDLRRYLDGLPVLARPDSVGYRLGKFVRRNRIPVGATAALILVLAAGLWNSDRLYRSARAGWAEEALQRGLAEERLGEVQRLASDLDQQRGVAERRFEDVRSLATTFVFDVYDQLRHVPGTIEVREEIVRTAQEHLETLAAEALGDAGLQLELAEAFGRLGDSQGNPYLPSLGQTTLALESYARALEIADALGDEGLHVRAYCQKAIADTLLRQADLDGALESYRSAVASYGDVVERLSDEPHAHRDQASALEGLADALIAAGRHAEAMQAYAESAEVMEASLARWPGNDTVARGLTNTLTNAGRRWVDLQDYEQATRALRRALEVIEPLYERDPQDVATRRSYAQANLQMAWALADVPPVEPEARERILVAADVYGQLSAEDPRDLTVRRSLGRTLLRLGEQLCWSGDWAGGQEYCLRAEEVWAEVCGVDAQNLSDARELATVRDRIGKNYYKLRQFDESAAYLEQARAFWERALAKEPDSARARHDLSVNCYYLAFTTADRVGREAPAPERIAAKRAARDLFSESADLLEELKRDGKLMDADLFNLAHLYAMIDKVDEQIAAVEAGEPR